MVIRSSRNDPAYIRSIVSFTRKYLVVLGVCAVERRKEMHCSAIVSALQYSSSSYSTCILYAYHTVMQHCNITGDLVE